MRGFYDVKASAVILNVRLESIRILDFIALKLFEIIMLFGSNIAVAHTSGVSLFPTEHSTFFPQYYLVDTNEYICIL